MAITFVKYSKFLPKDVTNVTFEVDENWTATDLTYKESARNDQSELTEYTLSLIHKKTKSKSEIMRVFIKRYNIREQDRNILEITIRPHADIYGYVTVRTHDRQRNIFILLKKLVKSTDFIKGMYSMRRATQREMFKKFGRIFENIK